VDFCLIPAKKTNSFTAGGIKRESGKEQVRDIMGVGGKKNTRVGECVKSRTDVGLAIVQRKRFLGKDRRKKATSREGGGMRGGSNAGEGVQLVPMQEQQAG